MDIFNSWHIQRFWQFYLSYKLGRSILIHATTMSSQHVVEEIVMLCERGTSLGNMLFFFFAKHSSQSNCTSEMLFFGCFSPNNSLGSMFPLICSLPRFSPNSPHEMLLSICSSWHFSPSGSWGSMGLSNCFSSWSSLKNSPSSSINKGDPLAPTKDIVP